MPSAHTVPMRSARWQSISMSRSSTVGCASIAHWMALERDRRTARPASAAGICGKGRTARAKRWSSSATSAGEKTSQRTS